MYTNNNATLLIIRHGYILSLTILVECLIDSGLGISTSSVE